MGILSFCLDCNLFGVDFNNIMRCPVCEKPFARCIYCKTCYGECVDAWGRKLPQGHIERRETWQIRKEAQK